MELCVEPCEESVEEKTEVCEPKEKFIEPENTTSKKAKLGVDSCSAEEGIYVLGVKDMEYTCDEPSENENKEDGSDINSVEE